MKHTALKSRPHGTTIIAVQVKDTITLGADSLTSAGDYPFNRRSIKIHKLEDDLYMGIAGYCSVEYSFLGIIRDIIRKRPVKDWRVPLQNWWEALRRMDCTGGKAEGLAEALIHGEDFAVGLVISPQGIYELWSDGGFFAVGGPVYGIGSGGEFAEGAARALLQAGWKDGKKIAKEAIKIAAKCCLTANAKPKIVQVKRYKRLCKR